MAKNKAAKAKLKAGKRQLRKQKKYAKKQKKQSKKQAKAQLKQEKKRIKQEKKQLKRQLKQQTTADFDAPAVPEIPEIPSLPGSGENETSAAPKEKKGRLKNFFSNAKNKVVEFVQNAQQKNINNSNNNINENENMDNNASDTNSGNFTPNAVKPEETFLQKHGTKLLIGGGVLAVGAILYFALRGDKNDEKKTKKGMGYIEPIDLS
ncbi:MAG: hypothetical protein II937_14700 [Bacteroidales bacterium]|nr:hypothetical protein [Bacteroidales bacterium]